MMELMIVDSILLKVMNSKEFMVMILIWINTSIRIEKVIFILYMILVQDKPHGIQSLKYNEFVVILSKNRKSIYTCISMLQLLILIIVILVVYVTVKIHLDNQSSEVDYVLSDLDHREYLVRNLPDKKVAAEILSTIRGRLEKLVEYLKTNHQDDPRVKRVIEKFDPTQISESSPDSVYTSYSVNKGEKLVFCIRQKGEQQDLLDLNTMTFVAIHELAHIMTESVGHTQEFWDNMKFLLGLAMSDKLRIYNYQPYHQTPQTYCGTVISDTPLKM
jgi:predicted metal-dependent hydrolase